MAVSQQTAQQEPTESERLDVRVSPEQRALIQRAATLSGRTLTDFMVATLHEAAEQVIRSHEVLTLSVRASTALAEAFLNPPEPNEALVAAYQRYHRQVDDE